MNLTNLSRYMSLILRHKPEVIGITLDAHGWANVDDLIHGIEKDNPDFNMDVLEEIVIINNVILLMMIKHLFAQIRDILLM
mgnify:CR=1 FL=1